MSQAVKRNVEMIERAISFFMRTIIASKMPSISVKNRKEPNAMRKLLLGVLLILAVDVGAFAQCNATPPPGVVQSSTFRCEYQVTGTETDTIGVLGGSTVWALTVVPVGAGITGLTTTVTGSTNGLTFTSVATTTTIGTTLNFTGTYTSLKVALTITGGGGVPVDVTLSGSTSVEAVSSGGQPSGGGACVSGYVAYFTSASQLGCDSSLTYTANGGPLTLTGQMLVAQGTVSAPSYAYKGNATTGLNSPSNNILQAVINTTTSMSWTGSGSFAVNGLPIGFSASAAASGADLFLQRDAANTLAQRNGANAQAFRVYSSFTDASNFSAVKLVGNFSGGNPGITSEGLGTGAGATLHIGSATGATVDIWPNATHRFVFGDAEMNPVGDSSYAIGDATHRVSVGYFIALNSGATNMSLTANGTVNIVAGSGATLNAAAPLQWSGRANIYSPGDGVVLLQNNANTDFGRLQFGGTTSSFPAIQRSGANVQFVAADASTNTGVIFSTASITSNIIKYQNITTAGLGVPAIYGIDSRTGLTSADGAATTIYTTVNGTSVFRITADIYATAAVTGTAIYTIAWTQNGTAQSLIVNSTTINTLATATDLINPDNATTITTRLTGTFTGTFTVTGLIEQLK